MNVTLTHSHNDMPLLLSPYLTWCCYHQRRIFHALFVGLSASAHAHENYMSCSIVRHKKANGTCIGLLQQCIGLNQQLERVRNICVTIMSSCFAMTLIPWLRCHECHPSGTLGNTREHSGVGAAPPTEVGTMILLAAYWQRGLVRTAGVITSTNDRPTSPRLRSLSAATTQLHQY